MSTTTTDATIPPAHEAPARPARSEAQRLASIANGRKSGGPREGRIISRLNATRHGLAARSPETMPPKLAAECRRLEGVYAEAFRPRTDRDRHLVRQAGHAAARRDWIERILMARADERRAHAVERWQAERRTMVAALRLKLATDPAAAVEGLRQTSDGCASLGDGWIALREALDTEGGWTADRLIAARRLLGVADDRPDPDRYESPFEHDVVLLGRFLLLGPDGAAPEGEQADDDRRELRACLDEIIRELTARCDDLAARHDAASIASAPVLAELDLSPEGRLLHRYLAAAVREENRALAELRAGRGEGSPSARTPSPVRSSAPSYGSASPRRSEPEILPPSRFELPNEPDDPGSDPIDNMDLDELMALVQAQADALHAAEPPSGAPDGPA